MLVVKHLYFERGAEVFFHGLNLQLQPGQLLQVTGANGAGKTTLLRLIAGFLPAARGHLQVPVSKAFIGHQTGVNPALTVGEHLHFTAGLYRSASEQIPALLETFALTQYAHKFAAELSAGQQRRLVFASLLLMQATLWLLDEPFTALDRKAIVLLQRVIEQHLAAQGMVILTTHQEIVWRMAGKQSLHLEAQTCHYSG